MKKVLKISGIFVLTVFLLLYLAFLFVLPKKVDLSSYKEEVLKVVKEQSGLNLEYDGEKLITTPLLGIGIKADNIKVTLSDNTVLFSSDSIKTAVSIPHLLLFTIKIPFVKIDNPLINAEIMENGEDYKIVKLIEDIINKKKEATFAQKKVISEESSDFKLSSLKLIISNVELNNYKVLITDLKSKHYLDLHGEKLSFNYLNGERIKIKTNSELFYDNNKNLDLKINISTFLPEAAPKLDEEDDPAEKVDFNFINPVTTYGKYDLKAFIDTKIIVNKDKKGLLSSFGYANINDLTVKLSQIKLPPSYFTLKAFGNYLFTDVDINTIENENLKIKGKLKYGSHPNSDISIKTSKIKFSNILELTKAALNSLQIPHELNRYSAYGSLFADCKLKTNFKKLNSDGFIIIEKGGLDVKNAGRVFSDMNINLILNDNILDIQNSKFNIGNSQVKINGFIDKKSYTNVDIITEKIPLPLLFNAFAPKELRRLYNLKSADFSSAVKITGKMKEAVTHADIDLNNLYFADKKQNLDVKNDNFHSSFTYKTKNDSIEGLVKNKNLLILFPKTASKIKIPKIETDIQNKNIDLFQNIVYFNDKSAMLYSGQILNYERLKNIDFKLNGELNTEDLIKFIGKEIKPFINSKGNIPINLAFNGNSMRQTFLFQAFADKNNYITPVDFGKLKNLNTLLQAKADFKPNRIKIKDTGFFTRASFIDENGNKHYITDKIAGIEGTIENETINLLKIDVPKNLEGKIFVFPKSEFELKNGTIFAYGKKDFPTLKGGLKLENIIIPEISTGLNSFDLKFKDNELLFALNKLMLVNSDFDIEGRIKLFTDETDKIYDLLVNSAVLNVEDALEVSKKATSYLPKSSSAQNNADIPITINNGIIDLKRIKTGNIELFNTKSDMSMKKNILALKNLSTKIFKGETKGDILVDLKTMRINTDLTGNNIDVEKALEDSSGIKNSLSGTIAYSAKLLIDGGASNPEAQMKGIEGDIDFNIKDGQFGPFGKLENLILAENIRESKFFQTALGGILNSLATIDTTHFSDLNGHVSLKEGMCEINPITSNGNAMNLHILGNYDLIKNYADMKVRIKLTSLISNLLGPLNAINPVNLINSAATMNVVTAKAFSIFCETVSEEEMSIIPSFSNAYIDKSATKFQLGVRGDVAKPLTLIKSFKWMATQMEFAKAKEFAESLPEVQEGSENATIEEAIEQQKALEAEKKTLKYKIKHFFKK